MLLSSPDTLTPEACQPADGQSQRESIGGLGTPLDMTAVLNNDAAGTGAYLT